MNIQKTLAVAATALMLSAGSLTFSSEAMAQRGGGRSGGGHDGGFGHGGGFGHAGGFGRGGGRGFGRGYGFRRGYGKRYGYGCGPVRLAAGLCGGYYGYRY